MQVSVPMLCDDSLMFAKEMFLERLRQIKDWVIRIRDMTVFISLGSFT
jgi:hypothetical protein